MSFFEQLKAKLQKTPTRHFDQRMKTLMDLEMGKLHAAPVSPFFRIKLFLPVAALSVLIAFYFHSNRIPHGMAEPTHESVEFLQNFETLGAVDEEELINASDEEWAEALAGIES
jgi:hypothetical protein